MGKLNGKVALIAGDCKSIDFATAKLLVSEGAHVYITGTQNAELKELINAIGEKITGINANFSSIGDVKSVVSHIRQDGKKLDILFASVDACIPGHIENVSEEDFDFMIRTNVKSVFFLVQEALSIFNDNGSIILNGSIVSIKGYSSCGVYSAMKAMLGAFARCWSVDLKPRNIRVNVLNSDTIGSELRNKEAEPAGGPQNQLSLKEKLIKVDHRVQDESLARAVLFLAGEDSAYMTAVELCADGALLL